MKINFKIGRFTKTESGFEKTGFNEYVITFLPSKRISHLVIVVDGVATHAKINLVRREQSYKDQILKAIREYQQVPEHIKDTVRTKKMIYLSYIKLYYSDRISKRVTNYLLTINKEDSRDRLTQFNLI